MNMRYSTLLAILLCALTTSFAADSTDTKNEARLTLWPGKTYTYEGVKVSWDAQRKGREQPEPSGTITFESNDGIVKKMDIMGTALMYFEGVLFDVHVRDPRLYVEMIMRREPAKREYSAEQFWDTVFVSRHCPIQLDDWEFIISGEPARYGDGAEYYQLLGRDPETDGWSALPVTHEARRKFGRFNVEVQDHSVEETGTAALRVRGDRDLSVQGRGAWMEPYVIPLEQNFVDTVDWLAKRYGFEVEWVPAPGYPESVELMQNSRLAGTGPTKFGAGVLEEKLKRIAIMQDVPGFHEYPIDFRPVWKDATHLQFTFPNYEGILPAILKKQENAKKYAEAQARFEKEYKLETRIYTLDHIGAATAKSLVDRELSKHCLMYGGEIQSFRLDEKQVHASPRRETLETCVADSDDGMIVVHAIPSTLDRVERVLSQAEAVVESKKREHSPGKYGVEIILLRGGKAGERLDETDQIYDPNLAKQLGIREEDMKLFGFDAVAELGKGIVTLLGERGDISQATVAMDHGYSCTVSFLDSREPYLVVKGGLNSVKTKGSVRTEQQLLENTLYLEKGKSAILGLTNLEQTLILVLRLRDPS